ncbi:unnamed protein product, partial [Ectocarpus sp. 8 AP-2014]
SSSSSCGAGREKKCGERCAAGEARCRKQGEQKDRASAAQAVPGGHKKHTAGQRTPRTARNSDPLPQEAPQAHRRSSGSSSQTSTRTFGTSGSGRRG